MPIVPPPSDWELPNPRDFPHDDEGLIAIGGDLEPGTLISAYRMGLFPMPLTLDKNARLNSIGWWSPNPRGILPLDGLHVSRSLKRSARRYEIRVDTAFDEVIEGCADPNRPHGWINNDFKHAYRTLHQMGWVHSFEAWSLDDGELAGGTYGIAIGSLFAAESMFHYRTDAGKVAVAGMVEILNENGFDLLDIQWTMENNAALGTIEIPRQEFLARLELAVERTSQPLGSFIKPRLLEFVTSNREGLGGTLPL